MNRRIGFMQGRLCPQVNGKIQAFPWDDWEGEFPKAQNIGLHLMEWTLDYKKLHKNPLLSREGQKKILELSNYHDVLIPSLTGDCFMQAPFWKTSGNQRKDLQSDFFAIGCACAAVGIHFIVVPLVDNGRLETRIQENDLVDFFTQADDFLEQHNLQIAFECDLSPQDLNHFISRLPKERYGINYDIGNSASLGFDPKEEFAAYGSRILNVHIKDRLFGGTTVPLMTGNADFPLVFSELAKIDYSGNYILQTSRSPDEDHVGVIADYRDMVNNWISIYSSS